MKILRRLFCVLLVLSSVLVLASCGTKEDPEPTTEHYIFYYRQVDGSPLGRVEYNTGDTLKIPFNDDRYIFHGYYTDKNGRGVAVTDEEGNVFKDFHNPGGADALAIFPKVEGKTVKITFAGVYGGESIDSIDIDASVSSILPIPTTNKPGYIFDGWKKDEPYAYAMKSVTSGTITEDTTLYAVYSPIYYTVMYYKGKDGTNSKSKSVTYGDTGVSFDYDDNVEGYNFTGYFTDPENGDRVTNADGETFTAWNLTSEEGTYTIYLYAHFQEAQVYTVTIPNNNMITSIDVTYHDFYWNSGKPTDRVETVNAGSKIKFYRPERSGYYFDGWYTDRNCFDQDKFDFSEAEVISETLDLYPSWVAIPETARANGATGLLSGQTKNTIVFGTRTSRPEVFYCDFTGTVRVTYRVWSTANTYRDVTSVTIGNQSITEFAINTDIDIDVDVNKGELFYIGAMIDGEENGYQEYNHRLTYSFTFTPVESNKTAAVPENITVQVTYGNSFQLPVYRKSGETFLGYYTSDSMYGQKVTDEKGKSIGKWTFDEDRTLYARYTRNN